MVKKNRTTKSALVLFEIALVALLGWTILTSDRISSSNTQDGKALNKNVKKKQRAQRWAPTEGIQESVAQPLVAGNGTTLSCQQFDFESGDQGFTVVSVFGTPLEGMWHLANNVCRADLAGHTTPQTFYYGQDGTCNYDTGVRNAANLISPPVSLAGTFPPFSVDFNYLLFVDGGGLVDSTFVDLSTDNGATWTQFLSKANMINDNQWHNVSANVTALVGAATSIRLRFRFDTVDNIANGTTGWHVDDVRVCGEAFNTCIQDDSTGAVLKYNPLTGQYLYDNCQGTTVSGTGKVTIMGSTTVIQDIKPDRRVTIRIDGASKRGTASIQLYSPAKLFTITDRNTLNNTCTCPL